MNKSRSYLQGEPCFGPEQRGRKPGPEDLLTDHLKTGVKKGEKEGGGSQRRWEEEEEEDMIGDKKQRRGGQVERGDGEGKERR